jgi:hypothetical protein
MISEQLAALSEAELMSCPFCCSLDEHSRSISRSMRFAEPGDPETGKAVNVAAGYVDADFYVECHECATCGPPHATKAEAIAAWNTRANQIAVIGPDAVVDLARALCDDYDAREIADKHEYDTYDDSNGHIQEYWQCLATAAIAALTGRV